MSQATPRVTLESHTASRVEKTVEWSCVRKTIGTVPFAFVMTAVMILSSCTGTPDNASKPTAAADTAAIRAALDEYVSAWKASDAGRIAALYSDDAVILPGDHAAESGRPAIKKFNQDFFEGYTPGTFDISGQDREIEIMGDWAYDRGSYTFSAVSKQKGGPPLSDKGKYIVIMKRQTDGSWKWFRDIDNSDGAPAKQN